MIKDPPEDWYRDNRFPRYVAKYLWWGLAPKTRLSYETVKKSYVSWCVGFTKRPFPATVDSITGWICFLADQKLLPKTIKSYLTGLRSAHVDMGYNIEVFHDPIILRVRDGIRRRRGEPGTKERMPITRDILIKLLASFDQRSLQGATIHASFCLAFAAFLRIGEFTWNPSDLTPDFPMFYMTRRSIEFFDEHLELTLPSSKTDVYRKGITITVAAANDEACPLQSLRHLYTAFPASPFEPLFNPGRPFTRQLVTEIMRAGLKDLGLTGNYSGHSFRRGAATWARQMGLTDNEIQILGRWASDSYKLYIDTDRSFIIRASRRHQAGQVPQD